MNGTGDLAAQALRAPLVGRDKEAVAWICQCNMHFTRSAAATSPASARPAKIVARDVNVYYGEKHALKDVTSTFPTAASSAFIGPSGCGKSTFLRCINRMNDTIPTAA